MIPQVTTRPFGDAAVLSLSTQSASAWALKYSTARPLKSDVRATKKIPGLIRFHLDLGAKLSAVNHDATRWSPFSEEIRRIM